jgi:hypothetical protein
MKHKDMRRIRAAYPSLAFLVAHDEVGPLLAAATRKPKRWWTPWREAPLPPAEFRNALEGSGWWRAVKENERRTLSRRD